MRYLRAGSGPPVLLVHGLLGYSFSWRFNIAALGKLATVYAPDLLGVGFSERVKNLDCSLEGASRRLLHFMDATGIHNADVMGTSHGGGVAATAALLDARAGAQRVRRLILVAPVNPWSAHGRVLISALATTAGGAIFKLLSHFLPPTHGYFLRRMYGDRRRVRAGSVEGYSAALVVPGTVDYLLGVVRCWHDDVKALAQTYARIRVPTLLIWGSEDRVVAAESAKPVQQAIPNSQLVMLEGAGHLPYEELPEEFNREVIDFLTRGKARASGDRGRRDA